MIETECNGKRILLEGWHLYINFIQPNGHARSNGGTFADAGAIVKVAGLGSRCPSRHFASPKSDERTLARLEEASRRLLSFG
jgi:hypothetical protein